MATREGINLDYIKEILEYLHLQYYTKLPFDIDIIIDEELVINIFEKIDNENFDVAKELMVDFGNLLQEKNTNITF